MEHGRDKIPSAWSAVRAEGECHTPRQPSRITKRNVSRANRYPCQRSDAARVNHKMSNETPGSVDRGREANSEKEARKQP